MYTDLCLMTADQTIGEDAAAFFRHMLVNKLDGEYRQLCVSPFGIKSMLLEKIDRQIARGKDGYGCILQGVASETENIHVTSVVGRFLEHGRIYQFGRGENAAYYISSADLMTRNLNRRVEIACPVHDIQLRGQLKWILDSQLRDTAKASLMLPDGTYCRKYSAAPFDSQAYFMQASSHIPAQPVKEPGTLMQRLRTLLGLQRSG